MPDKSLPPKPSPPKDHEGRRARKARETRERIAQTALALFLKQGFEQTTLDAIADAADISRRTFFHYFESKEAILQAVEDGAEEAFRAALAKAPATLAPIDAVRQALLDMISRFQSDEAEAIDRLMHGNDALRARKQANYERQERALFAALCEKWPQAARRPALQMVAMAGIGMMRVATARWREQGMAFSSEVNAGSHEENASKQESELPFRFNRNGKDSKRQPLATHLDQVFREMQAELCGPAATPPLRKTQQPRPAPPPRRKRG
jgi:AcrR family transcriptional regulator